MPQVVWPELVPVLAAVEALQVVHFHLFSWSGLDQGGDVLPDDLRKGIHSNSIFVKKTAYIQI